MVMKANNLVKLENMPEMLVNKKDSLVNKQGMSGYNLVKMVSNCAKLDYKLGLLENS